MEKSIKQWWPEHDIVNKALASGDRSRPFVFFEGPPTANGRPGVHSIEARVVKDAIIRYHRMRGQHVIGARGGWDTHGLLFRDYNVTMHCPRCGTSLSDHEVALGFEDDVDDPSVWVRFRQHPSNHALDAQLAGASFLAWTTTPWTLPANVALALKPGARYALVEYNGGRFRHHGSHSCHAAAAGGV